MHGRTRRLFLLTQVQIVCVFVLCLMYAQAHTHIYTSYINGMGEERKYLQILANLHLIYAWFSPPTMTTAE